MTESDARRRVTDSDMLLLKSPDTTSVVRRGGGGEGGAGPGDHEPVAVLAATQCWLLVQSRGRQYASRADGDGGEGGPGGAEHGEVARVGVGMKSGRGVKQGVARREEGGGSELCTPPQLVNVTLKLLKLLKVNQVFA